MIKKKIGYCTISFFAGAVIGIGALFLGVYIYFGRSPLEFKVAHRFGDITIYPKKENIVGPNGPCNVKSISMNRNKVPFLMLYTSDKENGERLTIIDKNSNPLFNMKASHEEGKWKCARYSGPNSSGKTTGEEYTDIDVDGHFDSKIIFDIEGKVLLRQIYLNGNWQNVDHLTDQKASAGSTEYYFDIITHGWQEKIQ